ncbi:serine/threonine-protein kinase MARK2-like isoform X1 [Haliotis cracherodii]|uniref:serine/threonine-protein kinase MARK2-like isoform X1 n=2 Tax=Haliotis cracherodii TaxID=6455 RepID=UPI0039E9297C
MGVVERHTDPLNVVMREPGRLSEMTVTSSLTPAQHLPDKVVDVPKDTIKNFAHTKKVGNYLLGKTLGEGSFAKVKEALHIPTGEKVAIKVIDKKRAKSDTYVRKNLRREGRLLQMVRHQNVVQLLEIMETENSYYLVTELCQHGDLMDYICKRKKLEEKEVRRYIRQIVSAVDYLHRAGILHRDLKIENLLLDETKDIKIIDFGLSNSIKVITTADGTKAQEYCVTQCGSPAYAAPELLSHRKYGPQVDVWSIGVNMYAMLTGSLPFTVEPFNIKTLHDKMVKGNMNPIPDTLSRESRDLIRKFLTPDPNKRITLLDAMRHPWLTEGKNKSLDRPPFPNRIKADDIDASILKHMSERLGFRVGEVIRFVTGNVPSSANATYQMYNRKLCRYQADLRVKGKVPHIDGRLMEPTKISLVFQELPPRKTSTTVPINAKLIRRGQDEEDADISPRVVTVTRQPHLDNDSRVGDRDDNFVDEEGYKEAWSRQEAVKVAQSAPSSPLSKHQTHPRPSDKRPIGSPESARRQRLPKGFHKYARIHTNKCSELRAKTSESPNKGKTPDKTSSRQGSFEQADGSKSSDDNTAGLLKTRDSHGRVFYHMGKRFHPARPTGVSSSLNVRDKPSTPSPVHTPLISTPTSRANSNLSIDLRPGNVRKTVSHGLGHRDSISREAPGINDTPPSEERTAHPGRKAVHPRRILKRVQTDRKIPATDSDDTSTLGSRQASSFSTVQSRDSNQVLPSLSRTIRNH